MELPATRRPCAGNAITVTTCATRDIRSAPWRVHDPQPWRLRLLPLTGLSAIHVNLDRVARAARAEDAGHLTPRTAGLMRYGLHLAASNLRFIESRNIAVGTANRVRIERRGDTAGKS